MFSKTIRNIHTINTIRRLRIMLLILIIHFPLYSFAQNYHSKLISMDILKVLLLQCVRAMMGLYGLVQIWVL